MQSLEHKAEAPRLPDTIPELTSVRFFAAMFVVLFHVHDDTPLLTNLPTRFFLKGYLGVDIFFILSGFILTHVYLAQWAAGRFRYGSFMLNRIARVYPLHLVMTLAFVALYLLSARFGILGSAEGMDWAALPFHLLAVHGWGFVGHHAWNFPSWSISSEFFAYLIFPLFMMLTRLGARAGLALASVALAAAFYSSGAFFRPFTALTFDFGIVRIFFEFCFGVFVYMICARTMLSATAARWLLLAAVLVFIVIAHISRSNSDDIVLIFLSGGIIFLLGQLSRSPGPSIMRAKPLVYLGEISYSTYMVHYMAELVYVGVVSRMLGTPGQLPLWAWLGLLLVILLGSVASFHIVEVPARNAIRRLMHERKPREWRV
jgi:peptidoglycan/LPS O-acetylase OafA/YrhL